MKTIFLTFLLLISFKANALTISEAQIIDAIKEESAQGDVELEVFSGQTNFVFENAKNYKLLVSNLEFDDMQNRFNCDVEVFVDGKQGGKTPIMGRFFNIIEAYVPVETIEKGTIITEDMLKPVNVKENRIKAIHTTNKEDLVGKEAKQNIDANTFVVNKNIQRPVLVKKNDSVVILYKANKMEITMKGYATKDGAMGDMIELINPTSKKTVLGKVVGKNSVVIEGDN